MVMEHAQAVELSFFPEKYELVEAQSYIIRPPSDKP
jgi:hypothetical protein